MVQSVSLPAVAGDQATPSTALGCLVIIGRFYGMSLAVDRLQQDNRLPPSEITTGQLLLCAERAGFRCTALHLKWAGILDLKRALPAIVRLDSGRSLVLLRIEDQAGAPILVLQDPEDERQPLTMNRAAFESVWAGDIILIKRSQEPVKQARTFDAEMIGSMLLGQRGLLRDLAISVLALDALALAPILFAQLLVSYVLAYPARQTFVFLCCAFVLFVAFEAAFVRLRDSIVARLSNRFDVACSDFVFDRILNLPLDFFETAPRGVIAHKMAKVASIRSLMTGGMVSTILDLGLLVLFVPAMASISMILTVVVLAFAAVILGWTLVALPKLRIRSAAVESAEAERSAFVTESVAGARTVKSLALDARQRHRWDILTARVTRLRLAESDVVNRLQTSVMPFERAMVFGTFSLGAYLSFDRASTLTVGALFGFLLLVRRIAEPVSRLSALVRQYDEAKNAIEQLGSLVNQPVEPGRSGHGVRMPLRGQIEFNNVRFDYKGSATPALQSISFDVPVGTSLGIMGRSGSGKTTITRLLQRLDADYQGLIKIDGIDAREYDVDHLRRSVSVVLQDTFLFSGTIRDNIVVAKPDATDGEVAFAARMAGAEEFIDKLPLGYDTPVPEGSPTLSDGQRQRLAIARALITEPAVLILDEATSALDAESEARVNANLKRMAAGRTTITISHRLSALAGADAILVLDRGEVQDIGRHDELLERCDIYSGLWQRQTAAIAGAAEPERLLPPPTSNVA